MEETGGHPPGESSRCELLKVDEEVGSEGLAGQVLNEDGTQHAAPPGDEDDISRYKFTDFASDNFKGGASSSFTCHQLQQPLLSMSNTLDQEGSLFIWTTILRFMGDLPEPRPDRDQHRAKLRYSSSDPEKQAEVFTGQDDPATYDLPSTDLHKVHAIIKLGILRVQLRDEIYCMLCKQLTQNPSQTSTERGWLLLSLCLGCFPPSHKFLKYLLCFIRGGTADRAAYCEMRLTRTQLTGARLRPPVRMELTTAEKMTEMSLPVSLMDTSTLTIQVDSSTTAQDLCHKVASKIGLTDLFGFSIYIKLEDKVSSLGCGGDHIMDAIFLCEQRSSTDQDSVMQQRMWRLYFRKEIFAPWHDPGCDVVSTNLIYQQVISGIRHGEYKCSKKEDLAMIAAQYYYVEHGSELVRERLLSLIDTFLTAEKLTSKTRSSWLQQITTEFNTSYFIKEKTPHAVVKGDVVSVSKFKWPFWFSRFYDAFGVSGCGLSRRKATIALNSEGICVMDDKENVLHELPYVLVSTVTNSRTLRRHGQDVTLATVKGEHITFTAHYAEVIHNLVVTFLDGMKERSKYAIALQGSGESTVNMNNNVTGDVTYKKGELIRVDRSVSDEQDRYSVQVERTGEHGYMSSQNLYLLATLTKPSINIQKEFEQTSLNGATLNEASEKSAPSKTATQQVQDEFFTLEEYGYNHFRPPPKTKASLSSAYKRHSDLWRHSKKPIKLPLHKKLQDNVNTRQTASKCFISIMMYMGDWQRDDDVTDTCLIGQIISPPLQQPLLRDEIFCQLIKQLTANKSRVSEVRGWQLMMLCSSCFCPTASLQYELNLFLKSHHSNPAAKHSSSLLQKTLRQGCRKYPPHQLEIQAVQGNEMSMKQQVYLPDGSNEAIDIDGQTRGQDMCHKVTQILSLISVAGLDVLIHTNNNDISVTDTDFFFDTLTEVHDIETKTNRESTQTSSALCHKVLCRRKLWLPSLPGDDVVADQRFHFHQVLADYLRGYHACSISETTQLAALIYCRLHENDVTKLPLTPELLQELVPADQQDSMDLDQWTTSISEACKMNEGMLHSDAKTAFIQIISKLATYGSTFFEAKRVDSESSSSDPVLLAVNRRGVIILSLPDKTVISDLLYTGIAHWSHDSHKFLMTTAKQKQTTEWIFQTWQGSQIDELITSYISLRLASTKTPR